ncbi:hypothetical protein DL96DRAFT_1611382 [Flagelloscypha sp. PMI_526]|nr:hypothetical protein DL96DRAFT_1611382 [Flagelloscypha sp. PMI_526]
MPLESENIMARLKAGGGPFETLPKPKQDECFVCKKTESEGLKLLRCSRCRTVPYCSKECQKADWKSHKGICLKHIHSNLGKDTTTMYGEHGGVKSSNTRTRNEIIGDIMRFAQEHNGDSYTLACWHAMDLINNIKKRETHFLAVTLRRNFAATNDWLLYTLIDADVLPMSVIEKKWANLAVLTPFGELPVMSPIELRKRDEENRKGSYGSLGSVLVLSVELNEEEENLTVEEAIIQIANPGIQPLGLFPEHRTSMRRNIPGLGKNWKFCLDNAFKGGRYGPIFDRWTGQT